VMKECPRTVCKPVTTYKTVTRDCGEYVTEQYTVPGRKRLQWVCEPGECCFDPCTCKTVQKPGRRRLVCVEGPCETRCRKVWKPRLVCEQVPCTTYVKETVCEKVPVTVTRKVPVTEVRKVPYTVNRCVRGAYVDAQGVGYECEGPGRCFKEGA